MKSSNILIITYYWPPAGGPGVQRWLKFCKYLPSFGINPTVYIPKNPSYPIIDSSLTKEIPKEIKLISNKIWEPYRVAEFFNKKNKEFKAGQFDKKKSRSLKQWLSLFIRGNFFIPDARVFWRNSSVKFLDKYIKENNVEILVTTGPPHSLHLIGLELKNIFPQIKWIADFRDPWTNISFFNQLNLTTWAKDKHIKLEKKVLSTADKVLATSFTDAIFFEKHTKSKVEVITNGYDSEVDSDCVKEKNSKYNISYIGMLEKSRNPKPIWNALEKLITENNDLENKISLNLVGKIDADIILEIEKSKLYTVLNKIDYLPHTKAVMEMRKSDLLILSNFDLEKSKGIIPGKIFEYIASGNKVIAIGPKNGDVEKILKETNSGKYFDYTQETEIQDFIKQNLQDWESGSIEKSKNIEQFHRKNLTQKLVQLFAKL